MSKEPELKARDKVIPVSYTHLLRRLSTGSFKRQGNAMCL